MKKSNLIVVLLILLVGLLAGVWLARTYLPVPDGKVIVNQSVVDSLKAYIAFEDSIKKIDLTPDTVYVHDTVYVKPVYATTKPNTIVIDSVTHVRDSLVVDDRVHAWVAFQVRGYIVDNEIHWKYHPVIRIISTTIQTPVHVPVIQTIENKVPTYITGHYISLTTGGNSKLFTFGIDYAIVRPDYIYGLNIRRFGDQNLYGVKVGVNVVSLFKKIAKN